ncbi:MAG: ParB/RepB/Spo0J family partition protein, partial [Woeseiaceae bacterium]
MKDGDTLRVPLIMLVDAPWGNVRKGERNKRKFDELRNSIRRQGVVQGITLRPNDEDNTLEVLAGYGRRLIAVQEGHEDIPAVIKRVGDKEGIAIGLSENLDRDDLSIVDEIEAAQRFISALDADYEEAAKVLGWSERKLKGRLKLNDCTAAVMDELRKGNIKLGHAEVLCQFTEKLQNGTLKLVLDDDWSVDYLKERASKATRFLRHAKFDIAECSSCPHNSSVQAELFDSHIGEAKCGNLPCYREKSDAWVASRKIELEAEEGRVFLNVEKPAADRNEVSAEVVGENAFAEDCLACVNRVRILQDGINKSCGDVIDNQCIDSTCFRAKLKAKADEEMPKVTADKAVRTKSTKKSSAPTTQSKPALSSGMKEQAREFARTVIGRELMQKDAYRLAVTLLSISELTGYTPSIRLQGARGESVAKLAALSGDQLNKEINKALAFGTLEAEAATGRFGGTDVVLKSATHVADAKERIIAAWSPSKEWLGTYQKGAIEGFCRQRGVGFATAYDVPNGKGAFAKLMKKKKDELIA